MRHLLALVLFALAALAPLAGHAEERTSKEEAKALAEKAAQIVRADGLKSIKQFEDKGQPYFGRGDTYVFVYGTDGTVYAHGGMPSLDGRNLIDLKDPTGKPLMREICGVQTAQWVDYVWQNPKSNQVEKKTSWVVRVGDYVVGAGAYNQ